MRPAELVEEAARIGHRIVKEAIRDGDVCTWTITTSDGPGATRSQPASDCLYNGSAGIAFFLTELWRCTGDRTTLEHARGALRNCERPESQVPTRIGLHVGNVGVALAAARLGDVTGEDAWLEIAARRVSALSQLVRHDTAYDIIAGAAGAIVGLIWLDSTVGLPGARDLAVRCGEHLEATASRSLAGWSWRSRFGTTARNLCGYAHGASGMAHAFLELFAATGCARWRFAASRCMAYERQHEQLGDWPDFRCRDVYEALRNDALPDLRARILAGERIVSYPSVPFRAWCHGAPGIALTRARAVSLGVDVEHTQSELIRALDATRDWFVGNERANHSLCHGAFGNTESILIARDRLSIDDGAFVSSSLDQTLEHLPSRNQRWITGGLSDAYDPSLMLGEAGIGLFLLRAARSDVPSALCISDWNAGLSADGADPEPHAAELQRLLPITIRAAHALPEANAMRERIAHLVSQSAGVPELVADVRAAIVADRSPGGEMLRDSLTVDDGVLAANAAFTDFVEEFCRELVRSDPETIDSGADRIVLAAHARLIRTEWEWSRWRMTGPDGPYAGDSAVIVHRFQDVVRARWLTPLEALILETIAAPCTLADVIATVLESINGEPDVIADLPDVVRTVLHDAVASGVADVLAARASP